MLNLLHLLPPELRTNVLDALPLHALAVVALALTAAAADKLARVRGKWRRRGTGRRDRRRGDVRMPKKRNKRAGQPSGYHDGLRQAYAALSRG